MSIRPIDDRVIIKAEEAATVSKGGVVLVAAVDKQVPVRGKILACGRGKRMKDGTIQPLDVKVGDIAVFEQSAGNEITIQGEKLIVVREADILAVIEK
jgi:chaperonin GroES